MKSYESSLQVNMFVSIFTPDVFFFNREELRLNYNILDIDCVQLKIIEHEIVSDALEVP